MINVTKTFLPPFDEYTKLLKKAWDKAWITNNGDFVLELEEKLRSYLGVKNLWFCTNGTVVLQMALKVLGITGEVITTPFSYVATTTSILWENCKPVFVDINSSNFCIDPAKIEAAITSKTSAILATHVYGYPCDVEAIEALANKYNLKVIYDGAHAFGTKIKGKSLLSYGDISTCSFHATKVFHTVEGGCIIAKDDLIAQQLYLASHFGHIGDNYISMGINGKNCEFHAAMGLSNLIYVDEILLSRKRQWLFYRSLIGENPDIRLLNIDGDVDYNYAYFPIILKSEEELLNIIDKLGKKNIIPRRYFFPALNTLKYVSYQPCPIAEDIAIRVICLPMYFDLEEETQSLIVNTILA